MRDLRGKPLPDNVIPFRFFGSPIANFEHPAKYPWPVETVVSAGDRIGW